MDLNYGHLYSPATLLNPPAYPALEEDLRCEVLVVGAGVAGALISHLLQLQGIHTVLVEKRNIGGGTSSASTGLLQFECDQRLSGCIKKFGVHKGVRFYEHCREALGLLQKTVNGLDRETEFETRGSLCFASSKEDVAMLAEEYETLLRHGFQAAFWNEADVASRYSFRKPAALYTPNNAQVNPYKLVHALVKSSYDKGMRVYENTEVKEFRHDGCRPMATTSSGRKITADKIVFTTGYEAQELRRNGNTALDSTYVVVTQPLHCAWEGWHERSLIWETANNYIYMRTTADHRIVCGGLDENVGDTGERNSKLQQKTNQLLDRIRGLFPQYGDLRADYAWASFFMRTRSGLPYFGEQEGFKDCYFLLCYGGNGSVLAALGAQMVQDFIVKGSHPDAELFAFLP